MFQILVNMEFFDFRITVKSRIQFCLSITLPYCVSMQSKAYASYSPYALLSVKCLYLRGNITHNRIE